MGGVPRPIYAAGDAARVLLRAAAFVGVTGSLLRVSGRAPVMSSAPLSITPWSVPAGLLLGALAAARGQRASAATLIASSAAVGAAVAPRFLRSRQPDPGEDPIRLTVMSANVYKGSGDPYVLLSHVRARHPDVLAIQEQSPGYVRQLVDAGIEELLPYRVAGDGRRVNDPAIFSRHPLEPLTFDLPSVFVGAVVQLPGGASVPMLSAHPLPPATPATERHWAATLAALPGGEAGPLAGGVIAGDFNATLDHPAFRGLLARGWRDAAAELGAGGRSTFSGRGSLLRMVIDHVLVPPGAGVRGFRIDRLTGSDHRLLTVRVELPRSAAQAGRGASG